MSTDVLIIGGGLAGLTAAVKIKEEQENLDVMVVDKGGIGWAGLVPRGGGHLMILPKDANLEEWVKWVADRGEGLSNSEWLYNYGSSIYESVMELFNWGLAFMKDADGKLHIDDVPTWRAKYKMTGWVTHKVLLQLKKRALAKGVRMLDKMEIVDLLKDDGRITGAVGFSILTGDFYVFKARASLLTSGACRYRNRNLWAGICGEMIAAAYRAGAHHLHSEFGLIHSNCSKECGMWSRGAGQQDALVNALGERILSKYFSSTISESFSKTAYAMAREVEAGRGPIYFDVSGRPEEYETQVIDNIHRWARMQGAFLNTERILGEKAGIHLRSQKVEWIPGFIGSMGNVGVDLECKSRGLEGLWAAGDIIKTSIDMEGAVPPGEYGGWGLSLAIVSGMKAAKSIAKLVREIPEPTIRTEEQEGLKEKTYLPMNLKTGFKPYDAVFRIQQAIVPTKYNLIKDANRLKESLGIIEEVQKEVLPKVKAANPHELLKYHEAKSMALCAEMTQRAALYRTETRGSHIRLDYPERDDKNWLRWTVVRNESGKMALSAIPVPKTTS